MDHFGAAGAYSGADADPRGLALHYHGEDFTAEGKWLFLRFTLWPLPEKEEPEKAEKKQEKKAAEKPKKEKKSERRPLWIGCS